MSENLEKVLFEFLTLQRQVMDYKEEIRQFQQKYEEQSHELKYFKDQLANFEDLSERIEKIESLVGSKPVRSVIKQVDKSIVESAYWNCSPKQHAVIQMIFAGKTTPEIGERLNVTENGAKSQVRYLCNRLKVNSKSEIIENYKSIWEETDSEEYLLRTKIPKDWCEKYGHLNYQKAKERDYYFKIICETNYRRATLI